MKKSIKISIIVPVYNTSMYLEKCLTSLKTQTLTDIEIICVNDGSTDDSLSILNKYKQEDKRFIVLNQENKGQSSARNLGIKIAKGEYIGFVDSDDYVEPTMFEELYDNAFNNKTDISMCGINTFDDSTGNMCPDDPYLTLNLFPTSLDSNVFDFNATSDFLFRISVAPWHKIYKKTFLSKNNILFPEGLFFEDNLFFYESFIKAKRISYTRKKLYNYRKASTTSTTCGADLKKMDFYKILDLIEQLLKNQNIYKDYEKYFQTHKKNTLIYWYKKITDLEVKEQYAKEFEKIYKEQITIDA